LSPAQRTIADAMRGKVPIHVTLRGAVDIETTFHIADEFGLRRLVLLECTEGYKLAEDVGRRGVPVVLGPLYHRVGGWDVNWNNAGLLAEAGVKVALASNDSAGPANLLTYATMAARHGLPAQEALRSVTVNPAQILGLADRVGTLAKGRDADLLILSGEPLSVTTSIETVIMKGRVVFDAQSGANADG
ncbi:MAG: amidohydrolase family protein, partial [Armatimonadota bacterium]